MSLTPKKGFDWNHVAWGHPESPPSFLCCYCSALIDDDTVPLILTASDGKVAQFCNKCMAIWWGMQSFPGAK